MARGDVAVVRDENGTFLVHLVVSTGPVRTATLAGAGDPGKLKALGRVGLIEGPHLRLPLRPGTRPALWMAHRLLAQPSLRAILRRSTGAARAIAASRLTRPLRAKLLEPFAVRRLEFGDMESLLCFAGQHLTARPESFKRQLWTPWPRGGAGVGAFDRAGRLCGFAYLGALREQGLDLDGFGIETVFVVPFARGFGLEERMVQLLCEVAAERGVARVRAGIPPSQPAARRVFLALGFQSSGAEGPFEILERNLSARSG